mgnify:CR=1 FL=1
MKVDLINVVRFLSILAVVTCLAPGLWAAASIAGEWDATAKTSWGETYQLTVVLEEGPDGVSGRVLGPGGEVSPLKDVKYEGDQLSFSVEIGYTTYTAQLTVSGDTMEGEWEGGGDSGTAHATRRN